MDGAVLHISGDPLPLDAVAETKDRSEAGGADARLRQAFERCGDGLYRFILLRVGGDRHAADDVLQQTCYEAARRQRLPKEDDAAQAWLFGIARNLIRKHFRQLKRDARVHGNKTAARTLQPLVEATENQSGVAGQADMAPHLMTAIATLSPTDQQLILEVYFEGRTQDELARAIGVSVRAIEGRLYRARAALREALNGILGENLS